MKRKVKETIIRKITIFLLFFILFTSINCFINLIPFFETAYGGDITSDSDYSSYLKLSIPGKTPPQPPQPPQPPSYKLEPIINWYDLQTAEGVSCLNLKIDVNNEYKFCISITSDQGWDDIEYININAWFDNGDDASIYNQSKGGNINMFLQYQNTTGIGIYNMLWPDDEVTIGSYTEREEKVINPNTENSECHNLTFSFIPGYQCRYAPGDGSWDNTKNSINDIWSWNFEISVSDSGEHTKEQITTSIFDEFGVNSYLEILSFGLPSIQGLPGENASDVSNLSIKTRSNVDYSLSADIKTLFHETHPTAKISKQNVWVRGGDLNEFTNFNGNNEVFLFGSSTTFIGADNDSIMKTTDNIDFKCNIPTGQIPGNYYTILSYKMKPQA
jgi:hypothetical protein